LSSTSETLFKIYRGQVKFIKLVYFHVFVTEK
jgi:hypothetical protein